MNNNYYNHNNNNINTQSSSYYNDDNNSNYNNPNGYNEPQQYNPNYQQYNQNYQQYNPVYNNQYNHNYDNQIKYNGNEPKMITNANMMQANPIFGKISKVFGMISIIPIALIVIAAVVISIVVFTLIANITSSVEKLPVAAYADKISVKATLTAVYTKNGEPYYTHEYNDGGLSSESTVNNSAY